MTHDEYPGYPVRMNYKVPHKNLRTRITKKMLAAFLESNGYNADHLMHACQNRNKAKAEISIILGDTYDYDPKNTSPDGTPITVNKLSKENGKMDSIEQGLKWHNKAKEWWIHLNAPWNMAHLLSRGRGMPEGAFNVSVCPEKNTWTIGLPTSKCKKEVSAYMKNHARLGPLEVKKIQKKNRQY